NAHVIVEEAPTQAASSASRPAHLLLLSARTPGALDAATANLAAFLRGQPEVALADVAHTLQVGRRAFEHRRLLVCRDTAEAVALLDGADPQRRISRSQKPADRPVAFLFPGVGDHYVGMARDLYAQEPIFRAAVDRCCRLLQPLLSQDLRALLYPEPDPATNGSAAPLDFRALLGRTNGTAASSPLHQTALAQPAVFVVEYALAQLLMAWGIQPQAMLGYSLGEYVAACVSGVLTLEDALRLVATRAQLIQQLPAGAMLAVAASEAAVQPYLGNGVCLAVVNSPTACVLAGPPDAIAAVSARLEAAEIACRAIDTSHAFHSTMLAPIAAQVTTLARSLTLSAPRIPYVSNVTGTWITPEQATDPAYWAQHMVQTVRFADGVGVLLRDETLAFVEVGPGQALGSFVRQHPACSRERMSLVVSTLRAAHERQDDQALLLTTLGRLWLLDVPIDWAGFYTHEARRRIPLPTYPFERQRFWVEPRRPGLLTSAAQAATEGRKADIGDWFYLPHWVSTPLSAAAASSKAWLVFADETGLSAQLAQRIEQAGHRVVVVSRGAQFAEHSQNHFTIRPASREDYTALLDLLKARNTFPQAIAHLWNAPGADTLTTDGIGFANGLESGFYSMVALTKALSHHDLETPLWITALSTGVQPAIGDEPLAAEQAPLLGICKVIPQENLSLKCRSVDVLAPLPGSAEESALLARLTTELLSESKDLTVAYRGEQRLTQRYRPERLEPMSGVPARLRQGGVYLITGGLGGIGMHMAEYLARTVQAKLVLVGRAGLPSRETWADWLAAHADDDSTSRRI
ncbi:MAG TPA: type I polyketide synthase, partial [Herpetosiphonaceae bacterium]